MALSLRLQQQRLLGGRFVPLTRYYMTATTSAHAQAIHDSSGSPVKSCDEIPGPRRLPVFGSMLSMIARGFNNKTAHIFWRKMVKDYGPIIRADLPMMPTMVVLARPDDIEKMFRSTMDEPVRFGFESLKKVRLENVDNYFEKKGGLLIEDYEEWRRVRSRVQTPMMRPKNVVAFLPQMDQVALEFMERIAALQSELGEMPENFIFDMYKWALESVGLVALNRRLGCLAPQLSPDSDGVKLIEAANCMISALNNTEISFQMWRIFPFMPSFRKLKKYHQVFLEIADRNILETKANLSSKGEQDELTLMEILLKTPGLSYKDVVTLILDLLFAGIDTTTHTLGFTLYLLARNPEAQAKLQKEIDTVLGDGSATLTSDHLAKLSYTKAVVKESLRILPLVLGTARTLQRNEVFSGYEVPKGWIVTSLATVVGMDENVFPRPKEFLPERWLRDEPMGHIHPFGSVPFSYGTRMCIGRRIAEQEIYTFLARAMHRFTVDYQYEDIDIVTNLVSTPSQPLRFKFTERR